ncbi:MAG: polysaccharide biosynthesis/export family protein [Steroidobacteraceae bacterium]
MIRFGTVLLLTLLTACASTTPISPARQISRETIAVQYRLGSADQVRVTVFNQTNLSGDFTVDGSGFIAMPLIGPVSAGEKTARELETMIAASLSKGGYLVNPSVAVQVILFRPYYILGEVAQPGSYPYTVGLTVRNAVATARGFSYRANVKRVYIQGAGEAKEQLYELTPSTAVLPGDTIRIPERLF